MLSIFVCEDNEVQRNEITNYIKNYIDMQDYDCKFELASESPNDILDFLQNHTKTNGMYFLDVELNAEINGIVLGAEIRKYDPNAKIVFITTHAELTYLTFLYKVEAMDYIPKDNRINLQRKITECIDVAIDRHINSVMPNDDVLIVKSGNTDVKLEISKLQFIESSPIPHKLIAHLDNRIVEYYGKIKDLEANSECLYRCHQSYVVNVKNIEKIDTKKRKVIMVDGEICFVSVRYLKGLVAKFSDIKKNLK